MTSFAGQLMVRYMDPAIVDSLLVPPADTSRQLAKALLTSVCEPQLLTVQWADSVTSTARSFRDPVVEPAAVTGTGNLKDHVTTASSTDGDGKDQIRVAMLDPTLAVGGG